MKNKTATKNNGYREATGGSYFTPKVITPKIRIITPKVITPKIKITHSKPLHKDTKN